MQSNAMDAVGSSPQLQEHTTEPRACPGPVPVSGLLPREVRMLVQTSFFSLLALAVYPRACPFNRYSARLDCGNKSGVILPGLVGVRLGEGSNSALESIASPQVATDLSRVAGARMGTGESPATEPAIVDETLGVQTRDIHGQLHISQLANIKVDGVRFRPPKEEITGGLHDVLSTDDPLTMARIGTGAEVTFENRSLGLLDLEEERVAALVSPEQGDITARAHASHTDDLLDNINKVIHIENLLPFRCSVDAKVTEMSIAADLDSQTCNRSRGEVLGHNHCRAAQKAKGRGGHATVPDRHELRRPGNVLFLQQATGVGWLRGRRPFRVAGARHLLTESPASCTAVSYGTNKLLPW